MNDTIENMENIRYEQPERPGYVLAEQIVRRETLDAKAFLLAVTRIILYLAIAEIITALLVFLTGKDSINLLFYAYAVIQVFRFLNRVMASDRYVLSADRLVLQKRMGETVIKTVTVPMEDLAAIREHFAAERLGISYAHVDVFLKQTDMPLRVRLAQILSYVSARLARRAAGRAADQPVGLVIAYYDRERVKACLFEPDTGMISALTGLAGERMGMDDRMGRPQLRTYASRALARAFPQDYPHVEPLVTQKDLDWADEKKAARQARQAKKREEAVRQREAVERRRQAQQRAAERAKEEKARRAHKKKARKYKNEDIFPDEDNLPNGAPAEPTPRIMEIPEHPEIIEIEYNPAAAVGRRRRGSRQDGEQDAGEDSIL